MNFFAIAILSPLTLAQSWHHAYGAACHSGVDILFLQDTTQTFENDLKVVLKAIPDVYAAVQKSSPGSHFGVAEFKDRPISPLGDPNYDYPYRLAGPMSESLDEFAAAYAELFVSSGGDVKEDQYDAMMIACFDQEIKWRPLATDGSGNPEETAARILLLITDAQPHFEGYGYESYPETVDLTPPANPGYQELASGKWQGDWTNYTLKYNYPQPTQVKEALDASEIAVIFLIAHADSATLAAWQWVNDDLLLQPPSFVQQLGTDSADIVPVLSSLIDEIASATCVTTSEQPTTEEPTTEEPTTEEPTTEEPTTEEVITTIEEELPTSTEATTEPTTLKATTLKATTLEATTLKATTLMPTTLKPEESTAASTEKSSTKQTATEATTEETQSVTHAENSSSGSTESCRCCKLSGETMFQNVGSTDLSATFAGFGSKVNKFVMSQDRACRYDSCCADSCDCAYVGSEMVMEVDSSSDYEVVFKNIPAGVRRFRVQEQQ